MHLWWRMGMRIRIGESPKPRRAEPTPDDTRGPRSGRARAKKNRTNKVWGVWGFWLRMSLDICYFLLIWIKKKRLYILF
jgi:hypothetical protein